MGNGKGVIAYEMLYPHHKKGMGGKYTKGTSEWVGNTPTFVLIEWYNVYVTR